MKYFSLHGVYCFDESPSPRRAWIEICLLGRQHLCKQSPSPRRAWIEIIFGDIIYSKVYVALPTEGVD